MASESRVLSEVNESTRIMRPMTGLERGEPGFRAFNVIEGMALWYVLVCTRFGER